MPYGIHSASDACQQKIAQIIDGIDGASNSQDDIIIWGSTQQEFENNEDPYLALLSIRSTHGPSNITPPTTLFFNRTMRTIIPSVNKTSNIENNKVINQQRYPIVWKRPLPELQLNDPVRTHTLPPRGG